MSSYWERVTTLVCDIDETCSVLVKIYLICFENTAVSLLSVRLFAHRLLRFLDFIWRYFCRLFVDN
jgi:hypothetical protein